jgi:voltage-gated potassium channel Kch
VAERLSARGGPSRPRRTAAARANSALARPARNLQIGLAYMAAVMLASVIAYIAAGWSLGDAVYMVITTVYTVGYEEVRPVNTVLLRTITLCTIVLGCTGVIFLTGSLVQFITINQINQALGLKRMTSDIEKLTGHVIICGFGRIGRNLASGLEAGNAAFVVLERDEAKAEQARALGYLCLQADATTEPALLQAGIRHARTLATVLANDAANVFLTLSARSLNPGLEIISRGDEPTTETKLMQAGASKVVLLTHIGAERMLEMILYRETSRFLRGSDSMRDFDRVLRALGLNMDMVTAAAGSPAEGQTVEAIERQAAGAFFIVQVNRRDGDAITQPEPSLCIEAGDGLVLIGRALGSLPLFEAGSRLSFRRSAR